MAKSSTRHQQQAGFGLIEALVALVVLAFGLLGMAALQLNALKSASLSYQRSVATLAAVDAQERLWAALAASDSDNCEGLSSRVRADWQSAWFAGSQTPLASLTGSLSASGCRFDIKVMLNEADAPYTYSFQLPDLGER
ncbi:type IV pilus modification protein PilV [Halomonas sp. LS-001]